ncbi:hypothetical protein ACJJTC_001513 [Scirpophaga incertulas]
MNTDDINDYIPSLINPRSMKKGHLFLTQGSIASRCSLSLRRNVGLTKSNKILQATDTENSQILNNYHKSHSWYTERYLKNIETKKARTILPYETEDNVSIGFSEIDDLETMRLDPVSNQSNISKQSDFEQFENDSLKTVIWNKESNHYYLRDSELTIIRDWDKPLVCVSFGINNCNKIDVSTNKNDLKRVFISKENDETIVECQIIEPSQLSSQSTLDENMNILDVANITEQSTVAVNLEIKRKKLSHTSEEKKVLILNTNAIDKLTHVIVQPPNYTFLKRQSGSIKVNSGIKRKIHSSPLKNGKTDKGLTQKSIREYLVSKANVINLLEVFHNSDDVKVTNEVVRDVEQEMSNIACVADAANTRLVRRSCGSRKSNVSPRSAIPLSRRSCESTRFDLNKISNEDKPKSSRSKNGSLCSHSPRKNVDSILFSIPSKSTKNHITKAVPYYKIVAGTHFAVDAFSYGEIPNVKHYFLTHFHSDHYSGLKRTFNKVLICSKITGDLCSSRLGVNQKLIRVINSDETIHVEDVEVTALDANHCPGSLMFVFTLPNGKTLLHTGDFRATPDMESYPIFWNKEIHTIYLDTTYCNPRYDFPTQEHSLEMAVGFLRQKKTLLEKSGKNFSSVLIVCGTYTIGKEKFFLGISRRVAALVTLLPQSCQLHVVPMRDITHEKLRSYLDNLQGAFDEVVAFKLSGWEIGKSSVEKDMVTIHSIPYSEHSSFSEMIRFVKFLKPKQVVPTVDIAGGIKTVQKFFPCPLVNKEEIQNQSRVTDYFRIQSRQQVSVRYHYFFYTILLN